MYNLSMEKNQGHTDKPQGAERPEKKKQQDLHETMNERISWLCRLAALIIAVVVFTTTILGQDDAVFVVLGLSLSIALLAIAGLQNHSKKR